MTPDDPRHGQVAGYVAGCREQCCRTAVADWTRHSRTRHYLYGPLVVDGTGTRRRIQALMALGWSTRQMDTILGKKQTYTSAVLLGDGSPILRATAEAYRELYDRLSMSLPPAETTAQRISASRARSHAQRKGYLPPLAWDDDRIDDPTYRPRKTVDREQAHHDTIDEVVVQRVVEGRPRPRKLTRAECEEVVRRLLAAGKSTHEIENRYGLNTGRYRRAEREGVA